MANSKTIIITTVAIIIFLAAPTTITSLQAPSPGPDCINDFGSLADCLSYVEIGSNLSNPDTACCPEISKSISTSPTCLCKLVADPTSVGLSDIDTSRALMLPSICHTLKGSPVSLCEAIGFTFPAPPPPPKAATTAATTTKASPKLASAQHFLAGLALTLFTYVL